MVAILCMTPGAPALTIHHRHRTLHSSLAGVISAAQGRAAIGVEIRAVATAEEEMAAVAVIEGGCHCGAVRFRAVVPEAVELLDCNCSMCSKTGFFHLIVPHTDFTLLSGNNHLASYRFGTGAAEHLFCKTCGIKSFYQPRSHPDAWSVNWRCIDEGHGQKPKIRSFDGRNWEDARATLSPLGT
jgi:hypothetical protein